MLPPSNLALRLGLVMVSALCVAATYALDRFGFEVCHRGLPLGGLSVGTPFVGAASAAWALFHSGRMWVNALTVLLLIGNAWQFAAALLVLAGVGFASCR